MAIVAVVVLCLQTSWVTVGGRWGYREKVDPCLPYTCLLPAKGCAEPLIHEVSRSLSIPGHWPSHLRKSLILEMTDMRLRGLRG